MLPNSIRGAWKDAEYRKGLSETKWALLPTHSAGFVELAEAHLAGVVGGGWIPDLSGIFCRVFGNCPPPPDPCREAQAAYEDCRKYVEQYRIDDHTFCDSKLQEKNAVC